MLFTVRDVPSDNMLESLSRVQMTVASGSPVKTHVRVNTGGSVMGVVWRLNWSGPVMAGAPEGGADKANLLVLRDRDN